MQILIKIEIGKYSDDSAVFSPSNGINFNCHKAQQTRDKTTSTWKRKINLSSIAVLQEVCLITLA